MFYFHYIAVTPFAVGMVKIFTYYFINWVSKHICTLYFFFSGAWKIASIIWSILFFFGTVFFIMFGGFPEVPGPGDDFHDLF